MGLRVARSFYVALLPCRPAAPLQNAHDRNDVQANLTGFQMPAMMINQLRCYLNNSTSPLTLSLILIVVPSLIFRQLGFPLITTYVRRGKLSRETCQRLVSWEMLEIGDMVPRR